MNFNIGTFKRSLFKDSANIFNFIIEFYLGKINIPIDVFIFYNKSIHNCQLADADNMENVRNGGTRRIT
jgi:hypothetical protein